MATLSLTNTFIAGTLAKASEVNQNFTDLINWSSGNIQNDNLGVMNGVINWTITTGVKAINIANSGNEGSIAITQSVGLNPSKATIRIIDNAAQTSGDAEVYISMTSLSSTIPLFKADYAGQQVFAIRNSRLEMPVRTRTERDAISSPAEGSILYVKDSPISMHTGMYVKRAEGWSVLGVPAGAFFPYGGNVVPDGYIECLGQLLNVVDYPTLYASIGTAWNTGGETPGVTFRAPDSKRRVVIGRGGSASAGPGTTLGNYGGHELLQSHNHSTNGAGNHSHAVTDPGHQHILPQSGTNADFNVYGSYGTTPAGGVQNIFDNTSGLFGNKALTSVVATGVGLVGVGDHSHSVNNTGSGNSENMPPGMTATVIMKW